MNGIEIELKELQNQIEETEIDNYMLRSSLFLKKAALLKKLKNQEKTVNQLNEK